MMATIPGNALEICIRVDRSTLRVDGAKAAQKLAQMLRRRFGAEVISTAVKFPPTSDSVLVTGDGALHPLEAAALAHAVSTREDEDANSIFDVRAGTRVEFSPD